MQLCCFWACSAQSSTELCRSAPEATTSLEDALSPSPLLLVAVPFSYEPGQGGNGANWFGIHLGTVNMWGFLLGVRMDVCCYTTRREGG